MRRRFLHLRFLHLALAPVLALGLAVATSGTARAETDGQALYEKNCQKCHGPDGKADTSAGKKMKVPAWNGTDLAPAHVIENVRTNKKHRTVAKKVDDAELEAIATYVSTLMAP